MSHPPGDMGTQCHLGQLNGGTTSGEEMKPHASCSLRRLAEVSQPEAPSSLTQAQP